MCTHADNFALDCIREIRRRNTDSITKKCLPSFTHQGLDTFFLHSLDSPLSSLSSSSFLELLAFIKFASMTLTPTGWGYTPPANQNSVDMNNFAML